MTHISSIPQLLAEVEELHPVHSTGVVRLPELIGVPFSARVKALVDHPHFQRLRKVRQLSLAYYIYPGAVHTRFEHSLGVFETMTRYLTALLTSQGLDGLPTPLSRCDVESLLVAALLHDLGHYPFAHLMEDLFESVPDHMALVAPFLSGEIASRYPALALPPGTPSLGEVIRRHWPEVDPEAVSFYIAGEQGGNLSPMARARFSGDPKHALLRSLLDGPVDADKMDYLYRDSLHCGVPYGRFIDRDRFFMSLCVAPREPWGLAFDEKGRISVELFAYARSAMYSEVYWHHSSRAVTAMLNRAFRAAIAEGVLPDCESLMDLVFSRSDEEVVDWLARSGGAACGQIMRLLSARSLYKRLLIIERRPQTTLFDMLERLKWDDKPAFARLEARFAARLNESGLLCPILGRELLPHEVLIDVPHRARGLSDVVLLHEGQRLEVGTAASNGVWHGIRNDFESYVRKIRVFAHPDLQAAFLAEGGRKRPDAALEERLLNLLSECVFAEAGLIG